MTVRHRYRTAEAHLALAGRLVAGHWEAAGQGLPGLIARADTQNAYLLLARCREHLGRPGARDTVRQCRNHCFPVCLAMASVRPFRDVPHIVPEVPQERQDHGFGGRTVAFRSAATFFIPNEFMLALGVVQDRVRDAVVKMEHFSEAGHASRASRSPSPIRLRLSTVRKIARPGNVAIHQALFRKRRPSGALTALGHRAEAWPAWDS